MAVILDLSPKRGFAICGFGWTFCLFLHTSNEFISGEKPLLTFLSNLSRSLLRLYVKLDDYKITYIVDPTNWITKRGKDYKEGY